MVGGWWVWVSLIANAILSQFAGVLAANKGRKFSVFYIGGLLVTFVVPLIVATVIKPKP
jgi:hypothetical protein